MYLGWREGRLERLVGPRLSERPQLGDLEPVPPGEPHQIAAAAEILNASTLVGAACHRVLQRKEERLTKATSARRRGGALHLRGRLRCVRQ